MHSNPLLLFSPVFILSLLLIQLPYTLTFTLTPRSTNSTITPPPRYYLRTRVLDVSKPDKNNLYVSSYHTGAGLSDAALTAVGDTVGFLNATHQQFDLEDSVPWGMIMESSENLDVAWNFVRINVLAIDAGYGSTDGFFFNASGLQWEGRGAGIFKGWLACDWWHGLPQLFWQYFYLESGADDIPSSCARVELFPVAV